MRDVRQDSAFLQRQYEALREEAIDSLYGGNRGHGLVLFMTRGMTAWLAALSALTPRPAVRVSGGPAAGPLPPLMRSNLTSLLANMVLACSAQGTQ